MSLQRKTNMVYAHPPSSMSKVEKILKRVKPTSVKYMVNKINIAIDVILKIRQTTGGSISSA